MLNKVAIHKYKSLLIKLTDPFNNNYFLSTTSDTLFV